MRFEPERFSFSARKGRGVHLAINHVERAIHRMRRQRIWPIWTLKGDVRKFYDSIDHEIHLCLIACRVKDNEVLRAIETLAGRSRRDPAVVELDLDLLLYGSRVDAGLRVPRPGAFTLPFVLWPLAELAPVITTDEFTVMLTVAVSVRPPSSVIV